MGTTLGQVSVAESPALARRPALVGVTWRGLLFAAAVPLLFLHVRYQPGVEFALGSTLVGVELSDVTVLLVGAAALAEGLRRGFGPLRAALPIWLAAGALLAWIAIRTLAPFDLEHAVSAAKFGEYALLALAAPLLLRRRGDIVPVLAVIVSWGAITTAVGLLQFFGADVADAWPAGARQPSFLGHNDFSALSGMALAVGAASLLLEPFLRLWVAGVALVAGSVGLVLAGGTAGAAGAVAAGAALSFVAWRRGGARRASLGATAAAVAVALLGVLGVRSGDYDQFLRFLGVREAEQATRTDVQTYAHHTLLAYIGLEIFRDHPVAGAGWQRSNDSEVYGRVLPAAHRRFPDVSPLSFPAPSRPWGVQNAHVAVLADLGAIGLTLWLAFLLVPAALGTAVALRAPPEGAALAALGVAWLLLCAVLWVPQNLAAGLPLDALMWLGLGAVAIGAARG